jgi:preprotein translocase subunit SecD
MNRFPLWKNIMVIGIVLVAIFVASPNMFGDEEAVHITRTDGMAVDEATLSQVTAALSNASISYTAADLDDDAALVRFPGVGEQLRANDVLREALPNHIVALTLAPRTPGWMRAIGMKPMALGLDLRGGVHFLYQVDLDTAIQQYLTTYETDLRRQLREANIRTSDLRVEGDALLVPVLDAADLDRTEDIIRGLDSGDQLVQLGQLTSRLIVNPAQLDGRPGFRVRLTETALRERQDLAIQQNTLTLRNRVNELGVSEAVVQRQGLDRILVQLPGVQDPGEAKRVLGSTATLEFHLVDMENDPYDAERRGRAPLGTELHHERDGTPRLLRRDVVASGDQLIDATFVYSQGRPAVSVTLNAQAGRKMLDTTSTNLGRLISVLFIEDKPQLVERDGEMVIGEPNREETVISVATINGVFSNRFEITGLTPFEGQELSLLLRAGSLAAPIVPVEERTIGPTLGQDNIDRGTNAVIVGYFLVILFIGFYYRVFGLIADIALLGNVVMLVALMSLLPFALTLPGIAGIVLTVGMAVDANVLIFERIREELANGNSPQASIRAGFDKAYTTIVDSNLTTLIAAIVLFAFGTGPIKGFAVTLSLGIATSMFSAITVTRALVNFVYGSRPHVKYLSIGGKPQTFSGETARVPSR